jgi:hypothetical protein
VFHGENERPDVTSHTSFFQHDSGMTALLVLERVHISVAVVRLPAGSGLPWWAAREGEFLCLARTPQETSVVCEERLLPAAMEAERGFSVLRVAGPLPFHLTGVLASLASPLADAGVPVFVVSTFDTDYVLVREVDLNGAIAALREAGHSVKE